MAVLTKEDIAIQKLMISLNQPAFRRYSDFVLEISVYGNACRRDAEIMLKDAHLMELQHKEIMRTIREEYDLKFIALTESYRIPIERMDANGGKDTIPIEAAEKINEICDLMIEIVKKSMQNNGIENNDEVIIT